MRPQSLTPLFAQTTSLPGIGPRLGKLVEKLAGPLVVDLLWHLPFAVVDRRNAPEVAHAKAGEIATLTVTVDEHLVPRNPRQPYRVWCSDETGRLCLTYFNGREDYLKKLLPPGEVRVVSGKVEIYQGEVQMTHPDHVVPLDQREQILRVEPVYGLTAGLTQRPIQKAIATAVERSPELPEWQDAAFHKRNKWDGWHAALARAHAPDEETDLSPMHPARARLAFDELLASQLAIALVRHHNRTVAGHVTKGDGKLRAKVLKSLPFELTPSQKAAVGEIEADMAKPERMIRLLQGDVGSGKTLVALLAMLICVEAGAQAALMAPTEILARQHHATIAPLAEAAGVRLALLTGRDGQKQKKETLARPGRRLDPSRRRHACAGPGGGRVRRPGARRGRRAASLRRASAHGAVVQGPCRRPAGDDGDADPAHPDAGGLRRSRRLQAHREAGRPPADRHPHPPARAHRRGGRRGRPADRDAAGASTGCAR